MRLKSLVKNLETSGVFLFADETSFIYSKIVCAPPGFNHGGVGLCELLISYSTESIYKQVIFSVDSVEGPQWSFIFPERNYSESIGICAELVKTFSSITSTSFMNLQDFEELVDSLGGCIETIRNG